MGAIAWLNEKVDEGLGLYSCILNAAQSTERKISTAGMIGYNRRLSHDSAEVLDGFIMSTPDSIY